MEWLIGNWYILIGVIATLIVAGFAVYKFLGLPNDEKFKKIKTWLLAVVIEAEQIYGGQTGQIKLSYVYGLFKEKFPFIASFITLEHFMKLVDEVLDNMRKMLDTNNNVYALVKGVESH